MRPPVYSEIDLYFVSKEIRSDEIGHNLKAVYTINRTDIVLHLDYFWYISIDSKRFRIHRSELAGYTLTQNALGRYLKGKKLVGVGLPRGERVLYLEFTGRSELREPVIFVLCIELMGRFSNVILIDQSRKVLWTLKRVTEKESPARPVYPGLPYTTPPPKPWSVFECNDEKTYDMILKYFPWVPNPNYPCEWMRTYLDSSVTSPAPVVVQIEDKLFALPKRIAGLEVVKEFETYSDALDFVYKFEKVEVADNTKQNLRLIKEWERVKDYPKYLFFSEEIAKRREEMITKGKITVEWNGTKVELNLPKDKTPEDMIYEYHRRYKKMKRGYEKLKELIEGKYQGWQKKIKSKLKTKNENSKKIPGVEECISPSGFKVLIGKNAMANDLITFKLANREDIFFHIRGHPGGHVIMKTGKIEPPEEDIMFCARKAIENSPLKDEKKGTVLYTRCKYLRRPKGGKPGLVLVSHEKTINMRVGR